MAVDIVQVCAVSNGNQASQTLALFLSVLFAFYTAISIALAGATILLASNLTEDGKKVQYKQVDELFIKTKNTAPTAAAAAPGVPLVPLHR